MSVPWPTIPASAVSKRTRNPIRAIVDNLQVTPNASKTFISLGIGDPTIFGNFKLHGECVEAVAAHLKSYKANGYPPSVGYEATRRAVAQKYSTAEAPLTTADVIIASGCSDALNLCIGVLCNEGQNILLPAPGFSLYETLATSKAIEPRFYNLLPGKSWEIDLKHLESLIDEKTACILINNPSNPCGSVYSREHLKQILVLAEKYKLPIVSDEIYADMVFGGKEFVPIAGLTKTVPVLTVGGLAKRWLVPGWRVGWLFIHDRNGAFTEIRKGLVSLSQLILGANSLVQSALPDIILKAPQEFYDQTMRDLEVNARATFDLIAAIPGLKPVMPQGAMYMMVEIQTTRFRDISSDLDFIEKLVQEGACVFQTLTSDGPELAQSSRDWTVN